MKKQVDMLDIEILKYLEDDARKSLKKLADDLSKKTSTIYHRLQRLKSNNVILGYSIIINPEFLNIEKTAMHKVKIKPLNISQLDDMFLMSFANFINNEFPQVLFIALSEDSKTIYLISIHVTADDLKEFVETLNKNPYIDGIETEFLSNIVKGQKLFTFNERWIRKKGRARKPGKEASVNEDDLLILDEDEDDEDEDERTMEISLDDDEEELKF